MSTLAEKLAGIDPQLLETFPEAETAIVSDGDEDSLLNKHLAHLQPLHSSVENRMPYKRERPWHRSAAYMLAKGMSNKEVAQALGKSETSVSILRQQDFFRDVVAQVIADFSLNDEAAFNVLKAAQAGAVQTVIRVMETAPSPAVQLKAAELLLNRVWGTPAKQESNKPATVALNPQDEVKELQASIEAGMSRLGMKSLPS